MHRQHPPPRRRPPGGRSPLLLLISGAATFVAVLVTVTGDTELGRPSVRVASAEEVVFRWSRDACEPSDAPDLPVRAFRDSSGQVQMTISHFRNRRLTGSDFDRLRHPCEVSLGSHGNPDPGRFDDREWIAATYTDDGRTVIALVHNEYQGHRRPARCPSRRYFSCWYNSVTLARSEDGGRTFEHAPSPEHLVAAPLYPYRPETGPVGVLSPSNIVFNRRDGHYYSLAHVRRFGAQPEGTCVLRTPTPSRAGSWRAWSGAAFDRRMASPYSPTRTPVANRVCEPVSEREIGGVPQSLTYNTYFDRFLLVGRAGAWDPRRRRVVWGFYFSLSKDLLHWTERRLIMETEFAETYRCGDRNPYNYASVIDRRSRSRNFATSGRRVDLYFTRFNYERCRQTQNRDLLRVPIEFSK